MAKLTKSAVIAIVRQAGFDSLDAARELLEKVDQSKLDPVMLAKLKLAAETLHTFDAGNANKKQPTRLLKVVCAEDQGGCGYVMRVSRVWLETGTPVCPNHDCKLHGEQMMAETDATTKEERVNLYHTQQENSLKKIITQETGKKFQESVRERGTYRGKKHNQAYDKPEVKTTTRRVGEDDIPW
jgi:hypothetical protein